LHGFADSGEGGEVHDGGDGRFSEEMVEQGSVGDVADQETRDGRDGRAMAAGQVIEDGDVEIVLQKEADCSSADVARSPGDENVFGHT